MAHLCSGCHRVNQWWHAGGRKEINSQSWCCCLIATVEPLYMTVLTKDAPIDCKCLVPWILGS